MRTTHLTGLILVIALGLMACGTMPDRLPGTVDGAAGESRGGNARASTLNFDTPVTIAQPGSSAQTVDTTNEDQNTNSQAGESFQLVLGMTSVAATFLQADDPIQDTILKQIDEVLTLYETAGVDRAAVDARLAELRAELKAHLDWKLKKAAAMPGGAGFPNLTQLVYAPFVMKFNGVSPEKLDASVVKESAEAAKNVTAPAVKFAEKH